MYGFTPRQPKRLLLRRKRLFNEAAEEALDEAKHEFRPKGPKPNIPQALDAAKKGLKKGAAKPPVENTGPRKK